MSNYWSLKDVANDLGITYQAIYKQKDILLKKGFIENVDGVNKVNVQGYNYLIERRSNKPLKDNSINDENRRTNDLNSEYIDMLKKRIEQLENDLQVNKQYYQSELNQERERTQYFKSLFEQKDKQLNVLLLPGATEKNNKGFFARIFNKNS